MAYSPDDPLRNAANAAFVSVVFAKHQPKKYNCWAESQARYVLGSGSQSFMVGYGRRSPTHSLDKVRLMSFVPATSLNYTQHCLLAAVVDLEAEILQMSMHAYVLTSSVQLLWWIGKTDVVPP